MTTTFWAFRGRGDGPARHGHTSRGVYFFEEKPDELGAYRVQHQYEWEREPRWHNNYRFKLAGAVLRPRFGSPVPYYSFRNLLSTKLGVGEGRRLTVDLSEVVSVRTAPVCPHCNQPLHVPPSPDK